MKDEFISMASHELRSPLTGMKLYLSMLRDGDAGPLNDDQSNFVRIVDQNTDRLVKLVNDLLDISRMTSGRLQFAFEEWELGGVIQHVLTSMRMLAESKRIQTTFEAPPIPLCVRGDRDRVVQILTNLLSNAYKYSDEDTSVIVRLTPRNSDVQIDVIDQGMGISNDDQANLFQRFFRSESVINSNISGTGLGLYITRLLVEAHGGEIWVESQVGAGSTFSWTLPLADDTSVLARS